MIMGDIVPRRLIKGISTWALGLGLSATAVVPSVLPGEAQVTPQQVTDAITGAVNTLSAQISTLGGQIHGVTTDLQTVRTDLQNKVDALDGRLRIVEDRTRRPPPVQPPPAPPPRVVNIHRHCHYSRYWCPPPWWGPWW
jgi:hypothetical protein